MINTYYVAIGMRLYRSQQITEIVGFAKKYGRLGYIEPGEPCASFEGVQCIQQ